MSLIDQLDGDETVFTHGAAPLSLSLRRRKSAVASFVEDVHEPGHWF